MKYWFVSLIVLAVCSSLPGRDYFITPEGKGDMTASSWEHAAPGKSISQIFNEELKPGDRLLVDSGVYQNASLVLSEGGAEGKPKTIEGVDRGKGLPVLEGKWSVDAPTKGATAIRFSPRASHVSIIGLRIQGYVTAVQVRENSENPSSYLRFENISVKYVRHGFYLSDCDDLHLENCGLKRYTKHGFRFEQGCDRVTIRGCVADCSEGDGDWEEKTELLPFGFLVNNGGAPNTKLLFEDCLARNNLMPLQKNKYKNGDGFVVEENAKEVTFLRCRAIRNQDGGFDLKVHNVCLVDCVAIRNSRGFRVWHTGTIVNCFAGWGGVGLWNNGGPLKVSRSTFHSLSDAAIVTDDRAKAPISVDQSLISEAERPHRKTATGGKVIFTETVVVEPDGSEANPSYRKSHQDWDGLGDAMNSAQYPERGYRFPNTASE